MKLSALRRPSSISKYEYRTSSLHVHNSYEVLWNNLEVPNVDHNITYKPVVQVVNKSLIPTLRNYLNGLNEEDKEIVGSVARYPKSLLEPSGCDFMDSIYIRSLWKEIFNKSQNGSVATYDHRFPRLDSEDFECVYIPQVPTIGCSPQAEYNLLCVNRRDVNLHWVMEFSLKILAQCHCTTVILNDALADEYVMDTETKVGIWKSVLDDCAKYFKTVIICIPEKSRYKVYSQLTLL